MLVLVSCDPASLGRDVVLLAGHGYVHESTQLVDVFPLTSHVGDSHAVHPIVTVSHVA